MAVFTKTCWISKKRACMRRPWTFIRIREFFPPVNSVSWSQAAFDWGWPSTVQAGQTEETSTPKKTCRRYRKNDERPTGANTNNWMGRRWSLKIKAIPVLILTEIFPSVYELWYWKTLRNESIMYFSLVLFFLDVRFQAFSGKTIMC